VETDAYDRLGRVTGFTSTDPRASTERYIYDSATGLLARIVGSDPRADTSVFEYDARGRPTRAIRRSTDDGAVEIHETEVWEYCDR